MIHKVEDHYVISSRQVWLPGAYDTERAAKYAFRFPDEILRGYVHLSPEATDQLSRIEAILQRLIGEEVL